MRSSQNSTMEAISISPGRLLKILLGIDAGLIAANLIGCASVYLLESVGLSVGLDKQILQDIRKDVDR